MGGKGRDMVVRRQNVRRDVLSGAMSSEQELADRYGVAPSTIKSDLHSIASAVAKEMADSLPGEWAMAVRRFEANALRSLNGFEESRRRSRECKTCKGSGWVKAISMRAKPRDVREVKCPRKFLGMAHKSGRVKEHRLVVAREINRCLTDEEVVHHIDLNERNNKPANLMLFKDDEDHKLFHDGTRVEVLWSGTPNVRPMESKEWCGDCDGWGVIWFKVPGDVRYLTEYRYNIKERASLQGLYPVNGTSQHLHFHEAQKTNVKADDIPSEMILEARLFQDKLEQSRIVDVEVVNPDEENE